MFLDSISHMKTSIHVFPRSIKMVILSVGLVVFSLIVFRGVVGSSSYDVILCSLKKPWDFLRHLLSSPLFVCFIINFIVILIVATSIFDSSRFQENHHVLSSSTSIDYHHDHDFQHTLPLITPQPQPQPPRSVEVENTNQNRTCDSKVSCHIQEPNIMEKEASFSIKNHMGCPESRQDGIFSKQNSLTEGMVKAHEPFSVKNHQNSLTERIAKSHEPFSMKNHTGSPRNHQDGTFNHQNSLTQRIVKAPEPIESETFKKPKEHEDKVIENEIKTGVEVINSSETDENDDDTMDATWRAIVQNKTLKKSDTWAQPIRTEELDFQEFMPKTKKELRKTSMSFNETVSLRFRGGMMRGPSISLEELHGRVEAHIKNFNNEMKLQRQESEQRYLEMLNRNI